MTTITEFITARQDAKAWAAQAAKDSAAKRRNHRAGMLDLCDRELREVAATRAILALHEGAHSCPGIKYGDADPEVWFDDGDCDTVRHLAAIDIAHPDYDPSWAPETAEAR